MRILLLLGAAATLVAHTATAIAAPAWCKGGRDKPSYDMKSLFSETDPRDALTNLIGATCYADSDIASYAKQIEATRQAWSKKLGLTETDWVDVNEWAHYPRYSRNSSDFFAKDRSAPLSSYSALDQFAVLNDTTGNIDVAYLADAFGARITMLGRLAYVQACMGRASQDDGPVAYAMCATDAAALDLTKIYAEIGADKSHELSDRMTARIVAYETVAKLAQWNAEAKAFRDKDPAYEKMFQLGEQAHKTWASADATALALMNDLDDAHTSGSRRASQGCMARAEAAWKVAVEAVPAKTAATIKGEPGNTFLTQFVPFAIATPTGFLGALALNVCAKLENKTDALTRVIGATLERWPGFRGPRTGTQTAILTAGLQLDQRDAQIDFPDLKRDFIDGDSNTAMTIAAMASVKIEGETATVTFQKQKVKQTRCTKGHTTNRIQRINDFGQFVYEYKCDVWVNETIDVEPSPPIKVRAKYAAGLAAGMTVSIVDDVVVAAYPKNNTTPSFVTGVAVK
ncbi:MAG: hypothetical protein ACKV2T_07205 [Kofleriaceae bacterium]